MEHIEIWHRERLLDAYKGKIQKTAWYESYSCTKGSISLLLSKIIIAYHQVVRMFVLVVMVFALCWLPYHAYFVLVYHHQSLASAPFAQHIYLAFYWLAMANSMFNPLIYYWMSNKFRIYFRLALCWCGWCRVSETDTPNDLTKQLNKSYSVSQRQYASSFTKA